MKRRYRTKKRTKNKLKRVKKTRKYSKRRVSKRRTRARRKKGGAGRKGDKVQYGRLVLSGQPVELRGFSPLTPAHKVPDSDIERGKESARASLRRQDKQDWRAEMATPGPDMERGVGEGEGEDDHLASLEVSDTRFSPVERNLDPKLKGSRTLGNKCYDAASSCCVAKSECEDSCCPCSDVVVKKLSGQDPGRVSCCDCARFCGKSCGALGCAFLAGGVPAAALTHGIKKYLIDDGSSFSY